MDGWGCGHGKRRGFGRARSEAERRADLFEDLARFLLVVGLLFWFVRPVGVVVGLVWGAKLLRRYADLELLPSLRRRWIEQEVARERAERGGDARDPEAARDVVERIGDDARSADNLRRARRALESLRALEREAAAPREVSLGELVEGALVANGPRLRSSQVDVVRELEDARVHGDPVALERVIGELVESAVDATVRAAPAERRIAVRAGENLARTEAWVRISHAGQPVDPRLLREAVRPFYAPEPGAPEFRLVLPRRTAAFPDAH
jgi:signal transduction histidine kinase